MTSPMATPADESLASGDNGVVKGIAILTKRSDFLKAAKSDRVNAYGFVLQARHRKTGEERTGIHVGFTCSKKVGNAVARNRAKRRLREIARDVLPDNGQAGWDYVLIGRANKTIDAPFHQLRSDLIAALRKIHQVGK